MTASTPSARWAAWPASRAAVTYLCWSFRITEGYAWLTGSRPTVGKVAAIGWWFVPLADFVMPAVVVNGLQRGLALPGRGRAAWLIPVWWVGFWLSRALNVLWDGRLRDLTDRLSSDADAYAATTWLLIASEALSVASAVALIAILVRIGRDAAVRQRAAIGAVPWPPPPEVR